VVVLVALMSFGFTPAYAACIAIFAAIVVSMFRKETRFTPRSFANALAAGAQNTIGVAMACAIAGIVVGIVSLSGLGQVFISSLTRIVNMPFFVATHTNLFVALFITMLACLVLGMGIPTTANYVIMATITAPMVIRAGAEAGVTVPLMAAHMFVFYFGIVADITPPVALAAYAGAAIAKSNPIKTGVTATRLAITAFIIPYIFVFDPSMLLIDTTPAQVIRIIVTSCIGMFGLSIGLEGYMNRKIPVPLRLLAIAGGLALIHPELLTDIVGFAMILVVVLTQVVKRRVRAVLSRDYGHALRKIFGFLLIFLCLALHSEENDDEAKRAILLYGTETEIETLIKNLKTAKDYSLERELSEAAKTTKNAKILAALFSFFGDGERPGLEDEAQRVIENWETEGQELIAAAVDYLGRLKVKGSKDALLALAGLGEPYYLGGIIRAIGRMGFEKKEGEDIASFLVEYTENRNPSDDAVREIINTLGELGSGTGLLEKIAGNQDERSWKRAAALTALSKAGEGADTILEAASSSDPAVRAAAVSALGPFPGEEADAAILGAFRDAAYRTRLAAAQAAGARKFDAAVPFLKYRAEKDENASVRDGAVRALGEINSDDANAALAGLFLNRKNSDRLRLLSGEMLLKNRPDEYAPKFVEELDEAQSKKLNGLYNGLLRLIASGESTGFLSLAERLFETGGVPEKSAAIDLTLKNKFAGLVPQLQALGEGSNQALSRKAKEALERLTDDK
jgi:HEAT repeat protein